MKVVICRVCFDLCASHFELDNLFVLLISMSNPSQGGIKFIDWRKNAAYVEVQG